MQSLDTATSRRLSGALQAAPRPRAAATRHRPSERCSVPQTNALVRRGGAEKMQRDLAFTLRVVFGEGGEGPPGERGETRSAAPRTLLGTRWASRPAPPRGGGGDGRTRRRLRSSDRARTAKSPPRARSRRTRIRDVRVHEVHNIDALDPPTPSAPRRRRALEQRVPRRDRGLPA